MTEDYTTYMQDYWDKQHRGQITPPLGGSGLGRHLAELRVSVSRNSSILCIGVGEGGWIKELSVQAKVWACDISPIAHDTVRDVVEGFYLKPEDFPSNTFDLILSYFVLHHTADDVAKRQVIHSIRALKPGGIYAVHYYEPPSDGQPVFLQGPHSAAAGDIVRTRETFLSWVAEGGGTARIVVDRPYPKKRTIPVQHIVAHVVRK